MEVEQGPAGKMDELVKMIETGLAVKEVKLTLGDTHLDIDHVYADFNNPKIWKAFPDALEPYVPELLAKISAEIERNYTPGRLNVDDPEDLSFWSDQFEISQEDLRRAALAAGDSIDDITAYLQK